MCPSSSTLNPNPEYKIKCLTTAPPGWFAQYHTTGHEEDHRGVNGCTFRYAFLPIIAWAVMQELTVAGHPEEPEFMEAMVCAGDGVMTPAWKTPGFHFIEFFPFGPPDEVLIYGPMVTKSDDSESPFWYRKVTDRVFE